MLAEECCVVLELSSRVVLNFLEGALQGGIREQNDFVFSLCLTATINVNLLVMVVVGMVGVGTVGDWNLGACPFPKHVTLRP